MSEQAKKTYATFADVKRIHTSVTEATYFPVDTPSEHTVNLTRNLQRAVLENWYVGVDTEYDTDNLSQCNAWRTYPAVISIAIPTDIWFGGYRVCQPYVFTGDGRNLLRRWFAGPRPKRVAHNANVDRHVIENWNERPVPNLVDTMTAMRFLKPTMPSFGLKDLGWSCLQYNWSADYGTLWGTAKASEMVNNVAFLSYAQIDAAWCAELYQWIIKEMNVAAAVTQLQTNRATSPNGYSH